LVIYITDGTPFPCYQTWACGRDGAMPSRINDPNHWRGKADEARAMADQLPDAEAKRLMLEVALAYTQLAQLAEARVRGKRED
jgi:hypothetical protein